MKSRIFSADWVLPVAASAIRDGVVVVRGERIAWLGAANELPAEYSQGEVLALSGVITPGLVNAHTHLQYSQFQRLGKAQYASFEHWSQAFEKAYDTVGDPQYWADSAAMGVRLGLATGTTVFSEIVTDDAARGAVKNGCATGVEYLEAISELDASWNETGREAFMARLNQRTGTVVGVSPHAPYSLDPNVIKDLVNIAADHDMRVHTHLAESSVEDAFYLTGNDRILEIYGCLRYQFMLSREGGRNMKAAAYADSLNLLSPRCHIAHGVYLDRAGRDLLLKRGTRVALCPRSNAVLGLAEAPVAAYLNEGHDIAVGTDSLASCPSLDLMSDVKLLADIAGRQGYSHADLSMRLMRSATLGGARALGMAGQGYGTLVVGGPADLAVFNVQVQGDNVELALVQNGAGNCILTVANGKVVFEGTSASHKAN